jgi:hypothetical protein
VTQKTSTSVPPPWKPRITQLIALFIIKS